jgi:Glycosyl transferase family 2
MIERLPNVMRPSDLLKRLLVSIYEMLKVHFRRIVKFREVSLIRIDPGLQDAKHVLVTTIHNEATRIPFSLKYYRAMGFKHFIIIDNQSDDGVDQILSGESGVSTFIANGSYRLSTFGCDWVNSILFKYCTKKWILYVDADEFFVFQHCDTKGITELTDYLEKNNQESLQCLLLDMYSDKKVKYNICGVGEDPLSVCRFYDRDGYIKKYDPQLQTVWIKGGVRGRIYFSDRVWEGPALNKTPLVFWQRHYAFLKGTHQLWPLRLNGGDVSHGKLRGVLLHFKFLADWKIKLSDEAVRKQHTDEYNAYSINGTLKDDGPDFMGAPTVEYVSWRSLQQDGLIDGNCWPV